MELLSYEISRFTVIYVEVIELKKMTHGAEPFIPKVETGGNDQQTLRIITGRLHISYLEKSLIGCGEIRLWLTEEK